MLCDGRGQTRTDMGKPRYILSVVRLPFRHSPADAYYAMFCPSRVLLGLSPQSIGSLYNVKKMY